jgi:hypothetical protein
MYSLCWGILCRLKFGTFHFEAGKVVVISLSFVGMLRRDVERFWHTTSSLVGIRRVERETRSGTAFSHVDNIVVGIHVPSGGEWITIVGNI